jgi:hypothetical protein
VYHLRSTISTAVVAVLLLGGLGSLGGCNHRSAVPGDDWGSGTDGSTDTFVGDADTPDPVITDYIYVVDENKNFLRWSPVTLAFQLIAKLSCPNASGTPFSMGVDRFGLAWIVYSGGQLFWVDIKTGSCSLCPLQPYKIDAYYNYGMSFVANSPTTHAERLFIAEGLGGPTGRLAYIQPDKTNPTVNFVAKFKNTGYGPELTGTGAGDLYAYFPDTAAANSKVVRMDKATAQEIKSWSVPALPASPTDWAFAHWGGNFYIFVTAVSNNVILFNSVTGKSTTVVANHAYRIVGAGVSTRAPLVFPDGGGPTDALPRREQGPVPWPDL